MVLKRFQTHQLQKGSILAVETIVNEMNCEFRRHESDNAGLDGEVDLVRALAFEGKILKTQIKAGRSYISSEKQDHVRVKVERKYVEHWNNLNVRSSAALDHADTNKVCALIVTGRSANASKSRK